MSDLIDDLSKIKGIRTYTDKDGKFHMTTKSLEKEEEEKHGNVCSSCGRRDKWLRTAPDDTEICETCYKFNWREQGIDGEITDVDGNCPFCDVQLKMNTNGGNCICGAIYVGGFDYDECGYYHFRFFKRK